MRDTLVLCYHALSPTWSADLSVTPDAFAQQLRILHKAGYHGVTFTEAAQKRTRQREVAVTFDDAFLSVVTLAKPVLDDLGWPATVYAVTDFAAQGRPVAWDGVDHWAQTADAEELHSLDWDALRALHADGWEIGSHTVTHPRLTATDDERLAFELSASKAAVEAALGEPCPSIAYPYGDVNARVVQAVAAAGYATGAALPARWHEIGALEWPRVGVYHPDSLMRFRVKTARLVRKARGVLGR
ncbi:MAG: polysaccharide deacetylase family protein [Solirubrobacteraceae bacterium]